MAVSNTPGDAAAKVPHLERDAHGRLLMTVPGGDGAPRLEAVQPVRAFPLSAPGEGLSLVSADGRELAWIEQLADLPPAPRALLEEELAQREFTPVIQRIVQVSTFSTPSTWAVETDRGPTTLVLKGEEDIRRLEGGALLIADRQGLAFRVNDRFALDRASRRLLERFL
jgi:hypothetical protein